MLDRLCANNNMDNSKKQNKQTLKWRKNNDNNNSVREPTCRQHTARTAYHNPTSHNTTTNNKHQQEQQEGARCVVPCCSPALCERYVLIDGLHAYTTVTYQSPLTLHTHARNESTYLSCQRLIGFSLAFRQNRLSTTHTNTTRTYIWHVTSELMVDKRATTILTEPSSSTNTAVNQSNAYEWFISNSKHIYVCGEYDNTIVVTVCVLNIHKTQQKQNKTSQKKKKKKKNTFFFRK